MKTVFVFVPLGVTMGETEEKRELEGVEEKVSPIDSEELAEADKEPGNLVKENGLVMDEVKLPLTDIDGLEVTDKKLLEDVEGDKEA